MRPEPNNDFTKFTEEELDLLWEAFADEIRDHEGYRPERGCFDEYHFQYWVEHSLDLNDLGEILGFKREVIIRLGTIAEYESLTNGEQERVSVCRACDCEYLPEAWEADWYCPQCE